MVMEIAIKLHVKFEPYNRRLDRFKNCSTIVYGTIKRKAQSVDVKWRHGTPPFFQPILLHMMLETF